MSRSAVTKHLEWFGRSDLTGEQAQELPDSELLIASLSPVIQHDWVDI